MNTVTQPTRIKRSDAFLGLHFDFHANQSILARKPLLIWGDMHERDLDWVFSKLPARGLALNTVVNSPEQAEWIWEKYVGCQK
jgi:hypothetical protein